MTIDLTECRQAGARLLQFRPDDRRSAARRWPTNASPRRPTIRSTTASFRSLKVMAPPGTVVSAVRPAPMRLWMTFPMTVVDTVFKALAPAIPDRVIAGHHADLLHRAVLRHQSAGPRNSSSPAWGPLGGGWGAKHNEDGMSATVCINDGDTHNSADEQAEAKFPVLVERYALAPDSGGAGRHRGGLGIERVVRARTNMTVNTHTDRAHCKPWGLDGGLDGAGNEVAIRIGGNWKADFPNAKVLVAHLKAGDGYCMRSGGGGGYGSPLERPIATVQDDVRQGYVSVKAAARFLRRRDRSGDLRGSIRPRPRISASEMSSRTRRRREPGIHSGRPSA